MRASRILFCPGMIVVLFVLTFLSFEAPAFQNEPGGYREIEWGTDIKELPDMFLVKDDGYKKVFRRKNDVLKIEAADLDSVDYLFYKGKFYSVHISFSGVMNATVIRQVLFFQYGKGLRPDKLREYYEWIGSTVDVTYDFNKAPAKGRVTSTFKKTEGHRLLDEKKGRRKKP